MPAEDPSVIRHWSTQESYRKCSQEQACLVQNALRLIQLDESRGKRKRKKETEEYLDSQPGDPKLLQEIAEVPVVSLSR
jgi:hypothetical protein